MEQLIRENLSPLPHLMWDTAFPVSEILENRPYRNVGDLLVKRCPTNQNALRLCGCDEAVLDGRASDYECFSALCTATPMMTGHRAALLTETVLSAVFGLDMPLSPYQAEALWTALNQAIEEADLRPSDVVSALNIESICYRHPALTPLPCGNAEGVDLYPIFDLNDIVKTLCDPVLYSKSLGEAMAEVEAHLNAFVTAGCVSAHLRLPSDYVFLRNSRKKELDDGLAKAQDGAPLTVEETNTLITAAFVSLSTALRKSHLCLLLTTEAPEEELIRLYDYLTLNEVAPETVLTVSHPEDYVAFLHRHTVRTEKGLPSLRAVAKDGTLHADLFPVGTALLPCTDVIDTVSLAACHRARWSLIHRLLPLSSDADTLSSLAEDVVYGNVKNRFGI